jgi:dolichyl-phosphate-mannose-protein mannosyltransferase
MFESNSVEVGSGDLTRPFFSLRSVATRIECSRTLALTALVSVAVAVRLFALGASGFSEDEINKLRAIDAYARGDFSANAEHPMLMKLAGWASVSGVRWWNAHGAPTPAAVISSEVALRLPNAIVGAATTSVVFVLTELLFDTATGAWAALFWAFDANAAAINRIGKEDTFLLGLLLLASYWYERGKQIAPVDTGARDRWYSRSGAAFGLMLASKYMPHYFGLHTLFIIAGDQNPDDKTPDKRVSFFLLMAGAFLAANVALLLPSTWHYLLAYAHGDTLRHTGYNFAHHIYVNSVDASPSGLPVWFYATFIATKIPLVTLAAAALGLAWAWRHRRHRGATFIRVFLLFTLLPYSLVASKFLRYMLPTIAVLDIAAAVGVAWFTRWIDDRRLRLAVALGIVCSVAIDGMSAAPYYGLAQNTIGASLAAPASLFPDDELYDAGVREAVEAIARVAAPNAVICSDATAVVGEYLSRYGRADAIARSISHDGIPMQRADVWIVVQDGHRYFENAATIDALERRLTPWIQIHVNGISAVRVYRLT